MRFSHTVNHAMIALDEILRFSHSPAMRMTDITPDWIARMRDARSLKDVDIYTAIGMPQDFFSKSMNGRRKFSTVERDAIFEFFAGPANAELPIVSVAIAELGSLTEADQKRVLDLIHRLRDGTGQGRV